MPIVVESVYSISNINTNKYIAEAPFTAYGDLVYVRSSWWYGLPTEQIRNLRINFGTYYGFAVRQEFKRNDSDEDSDAFWKFFSAYSSTYTIDKWCQYLSGPYVITSLNTDTVKGLEALSKKCLIHHRTLKMEDIEFFYPLIRSSIEAFIERHKSTGVFIKLSDSSGKKSNPVQPKFSLLDIIEEIVNNRDLVQSLVRFGCQSAILLTPWHCEINKNNEFRVIVYDRHVSAISQQQCYKYSGLNAHLAESCARAIIQMVEDMTKSIGSLPYKCCVMDVWINDRGANLIEMNPGEMWSTSGSALFNWETDRAIIEQTIDTYVRYIDMSSPMLKGKISMSSMGSGFNSSGSGSDIMGSLQL